jgi:protoporphyrinogen oxidase
MDIAIVGGGPAGLAAAYDLARSGGRVALYDDQPEVGGQLRTRHEHGFLIEEGAEGFVAGDTAVPALCKALGIADQIVPQIERRSLLYRNQVLSPLSSRDGAALLGIPVPDESGPGGLSTLRNGMQTLTDALADAFRRLGDVKVNHTVTGIERRNGEWRVTAANGASVVARHLVLAVPPRASARLLAPLDPEAAAILASVVLTSTVSVSLAYERRHVANPLAASGLVVAPDEPDAGGLRACAFCSSKFERRAPEGHALLRAFYRPTAAEMAVATAEWVRRATETLGRILGISAQPAHTWVSRWPDAIPQLGDGHHNLMSRLKLRANRLGDLHLAGAAYGPGGIPGAVRSGRDLARQLAGPLPA